MQTRVAHILRKYDPAAWGGTETHVAALSAEQRAFGVEAEVHAPAGPKTPDHALADHVPLHRFRAFCPFIGAAAKRASLLANAGNIASFHELLRLASDRSLSLAHVHTLGRIGGAVRTAMRATGRPYVVSVHGPLLAEPELLRADTRRRLEGLVDLGSPLGWALGARRVLHDAARIICFNPDEHRALQAKHGERAVLLDQGVDVERFARGSAARARERWPHLAGGGPIVLLAGRLSDQKNQLLAVRALASLPSDVRLVLVGAETDDGYRDEVLREAERLGVRGRMVLLGNLHPDRELPDAMALASLVIMPSKHEAFGLVALEAWAAARPVLMARHSGLARLADRFGDAQWGIESMTPEDWAAAIRRMLRRPDECRRAAKRGHALVSAHYTWPAMAGRVSDLYREVLDERGVRARTA